MYSQKITVSLMVHCFCITPETLSWKGTPKRGPGYVTRPELPAGTRRQRDERQQQSAACRLPK